MLPKNKASARLKEFDRQVENLLQKGYPQAAGISTTEFFERIKPLRARLGNVAAGELDIEKGRLPFVIVVKSNFVPVETAMQLVEWAGKKGFTNLYPVKPEDFQPIADVKIPDGIAYLLVDIDRGKKNLDIAPADALKRIQRANRSPLTIDEGIAVITHYPEFLKKNNCFSLLGSRRGDLRVPALWLSENKPKLGWCWNGNSHPWLGSASCAKRVGITDQIRLEAA
ncbi:MAG TPA: DUF5701 family protein [Anaerolineae bacterium]|nr:DUF5701 family protein [Anaerolineae bacterium]